MNKYAKASIKAVNHYNHSIVKDIVRSWQIVMLDVFPTQKPSRNKGCPRSTFLGLCENGYVKGVPIGNYKILKNSKNKNYAIKALKLLKSNPHLATLKPKILWEFVMNGVSKTPNSQMDIVLALWNEGLINLDNHETTHL